MNSFSDLHEMGIHEEALSSQLFHAVEALTFDVYDSSSNLQSYSQPTVLNQSNFVRFFLSILEEFNTMSAEDSNA